MKHERMKGSVAVVSRIDLPGARPQVRVRGDFTYLEQMNIIFVTGMGRSGTSAVTRILSLCGAALPDRVVRPGPANPRGYWEAEIALKRNDQFLQALGSSYLDPSLGFLHTQISRKAQALHARNICSFLSGLPKADAVVIKDPRISGLVESWDTAARSSGLVPKYVHVFRHPCDVAASLHARYGLSIGYSFALWLKYNLLPERMTRHAPRIFASYRQLLKDWQQIVHRCNEQLQLTLLIDDKAIAEVEKFLAHDLEHHRTAETDPADDATSGQWVSRTYSMLRKAAQTGTIDETEADRIFAEYAGTERFFREAQRHYEERFLSTPLPRRSIPSKRQKAHESSV